MSNSTRTVTGVAELCALAPVDKWQILDALSAAAEEFELNHRTLSVLRALITFLPAREITAELNSCIVFPSNRTLSERLHGMPESTLRRHLAKLVKLGIISRHDSANRKRFARRGSEIAYGFDLSPLAVHASHIESTAQTLKLLTQECQKLRDDIACLRRNLMEQGMHSNDELLLTSQRLLRRKLSKTELLEMHTQLINRLRAAPQSPTETQQMSAKHTQNERHIQTKSKSTFDSEEITATETRYENKQQHQTGTTASFSNPSLVEVLEICREYSSYFTETPHSWTDLHRMIARLVPMIGIEVAVYWQAERTMGREVAASTVLCILERLPQIHNPGGYLRQLSKRAEKGLFSLAPMISALKRADRLSADNHLAANPQTA